MPDFKKLKPVSDFYKNKKQEKLSSREQHKLDLLIQETKLANQDREELNKTGQIKNPNSIQYKRNVRTQPDIKQDNISTEQRNAQLSPLQRPLIYLANPEKVLGDLGVPNMETSELDRQAINRNRFNPYQSRTDRFINNAKIGLGYVPQATVNTALAAAFMPEGSGVLGLVNETLNPLAGTGDLVNNLGNKYLPNAYKYNPFAFKPKSDALYRGIAESGFNDAIESSMIRAPKGSVFGDEVFTSMDFEIAKNYSRGNNPMGYKVIKNRDGSFNVPEININDKSYVAEIPKTLIDDSTQIIGNEVRFNNPISNDNVKFYKEDWLQGYKQIEVPKSNFKSEIDLVDVNKSVKPAWQMQELPGLHLKSTMEGEAISKIVEPKTGLVNVEQALGIIGKESGGADKVALIKQGLGENIPKKMDYNEFRKTVQDQLIPLEKQFSEHASDYGLSKLGYGKYKTVINERGNPILQPLKGKNLEPLENQTLILGNKNKFGRGSSAHGNPEETLGHVHFLRDAETPDVLTVTQIQSDAFQGTHRIMPKTQQEALEKVNKLKEEGVEIKSMFGDGKESSNAVLANYEKHLQLDEASAKNFTQKQLLDKNHQERYLQELVDYAGKRGDVNKVRVPTSETAAKVQGYSKTDRVTIKNPNLNTLDMDNSALKKFIEFRKEGLSKEEIVKKMDSDFSYQELSLEDKKFVDDIYNEPLENINISHDYQSESKTILKKYSEQPKTIKKLLFIFKIRAFSNSVINSSSILLITNS